MTTEQRRQVVTYLRAAYPISERPRWGYKRLHVLLQREGHRVNHKLVYRLYREERLAVRRRTQRTSPRLPAVAPTAPNQRWGMDFIHDQFVEGRRFQLSDESTSSPGSVRGSKWTLPCQRPE